MKKVFALAAIAALVAFSAPAFAANPFMDIPMNHWSYDAVGQLAARGIVSGYPDGTYKGNQPITRYEMASVVARALAVVDMEKASKQDVEMLKRLVIEFKDELDALGVKVDKIDSRLAVMEENLGGWKLWGQFRFDAKFEGENGLYGDEYVLDGDTEFNLNKYRLWISKQIDENTKFVGRLGTVAGGACGSCGTRWDRYYVETKLPYDVTMTVGHWATDWEGDAELYIDEDALFTDLGLKGFLFDKNFGLGDFHLFVAHNDDAADPDNEDYMFYGARANFNFNEQFRFALNGMLKAYDNADDQDEAVYWADFAFNFNPNIAFRGAYFMQDLDMPYWGDEDSPKAYKAIIDIKQDALKFTSVWLEYLHLDEGLNVWNNNNGGDAWAYDAFGASALINRGYSDTNVIFASLSQRWNDKWGTFERYMSAEFDVPGVDDATNWSFGVQYFYSPAITFELAYDKVDWGSSTAVGARVDDDNVIRFRTAIDF